jgi:trimeric autotransporter adhesin
VKKKRLKIISIIMAYLFLFSTTAWAMPQVPTVVSGNSTITKPDAQTMQIKQTSDKSIINWQGYSIGAKEKVQYFQPGSNSVSLNRVVGQDISQIYGQLSANGQVWVINPNGLLVGSGATINTGSFLGSTLNISDDNFLKGNYTFKQQGALASIRNLGSIISQNGGYVALISPTITNEGSITSNLGKAYLATGSEVTLNFAGNDLIGFTIDKEAAEAALGITNKGTISANGGEVILSAKVASALMKTVVNNEGVIEAKTIAEKDGKIYLLGDMDHNTVAVAGKLDASAPTGGAGGFIETSAARVKVADGAVITTFAPYGKNGKWLIDPQDYTIAASNGDISGSTLSTNLGLGDVEILSSNGATAGAGDINVNDTVSWSANKLTLSAARDVNINAVMTASSSSALEMNTAGSVAGGTVRVASGGRVDFGTRFGTGFLTINTHDYTVINSLGSEGIGAGTNLQGINGGLDGYYALGSNIDASDTANWNWNGSIYNGFDPLGSNAAKFTGVFDGLGHTITGLTINRPTTNYVGLFGYTGGSASAVRNVGLVGGAIEGRSIVGGLVGYNEGSIANSYNTGAVTGKGNYVRVGGLVGNNNGAIKDSYNDGAVTATGSSINVGGLAGYNETNVSIDNSYNTGKVTGSSSEHGYNSNNVGGLVGYNAGKIINTSYNGGEVSGGAGSNIGGLAGMNSTGGFISNSHNTGTVTGSGTGTDYVGGLVGDNIGSITNSYNEGTVSGINYIMSYVGGLAGMNSTGGTISDSHNSGAVTGDNDTGGLAGGNVGSITNSYNTGAVIGTDTASYVGGLAGMNGGVIRTSYNSGAVTGSGGTTRVGGLVGCNDSSVQNSFWDMDINSGLTATGGGTGTCTNCIGLTTLASMTQAPYEAQGWDFTNDWWMSEGNTRPFLRMEYSTNITNAHQLQLMALDLGATYTLGKNIDMSELTLASKSGMWDITKGFVPVGDNTTQFTGSLDGLGHTINNLYINRSTENYVGLFGYTGSGSAISNVGLVGGSVTGANNVGSLAGYNTGAISDSHNDGAVNGTGENVNVGGLVGDNDTQGSITNSYNSGTVIGSGTYSMVGGLAGHSGGSITNSYNIGAIDGTGDRSAVGGLVGENKGSITNTSHNEGEVKGTGEAVIVGGLVGYNNTDSSIDNSCNSGNVTGTGVYGETGGLAGYNQGSIDNGSSNSGIVSGTGDYVGGLVGYNIGDIKNSHNDGAVSGTGAYVGGLAGYNVAFVSIDNSYNTGKVTGSDTISGNDPNNVGGLVGYNAGSITNASYNEGEVSGGSGSNIGGLSGKNDTGGAITNSYNTGTVTGTGNDIWVGGLVGGNKGSIDNSHNTGKVTGGDSVSVDASNNVGGLVGYNAGSITNASYNESEVKGGNFSNIGGLVGWNDDAGTISNSYNKDVGTVTGTGNNISVGGLVGVNKGAINDSYNSGDVTGEGAAIIVGGLVSWNDVTGTISNSSNSGTVTGSDSVSGYDPNSIGGLTGYNAGTITDASYNEGEVSGGAGSGIGGLAGYNKGSITNACYNEGEVSGGAGSGVGGLVGMNDSTGAISNSHNSGDVDGESDVGGLVGYNKGSVANSYNEGTVSGISNVGGLVGTNFGGSISNSHNTGDVTANGSGDNVGGLVGLNTGDSDTNKGTISDSYNEGEVSASDGLNAGGLVGKNDSYGSIDASYNTGDVSRTAWEEGGYTGGLAGYNSGSIDDSYNIGEVNSNVNDTGGLVGKNDHGAITNSYNTGKVNAEADIPAVDNTGGLAGSTDGGSITDSYNEGTVSGRGNYVGGLVGHNDFGAISTSYNGGAVSGWNHVGGLVGHNSSGAINNAYSIGAVRGANQVGGLIGSNDLIDGGSINNTYSSGHIHVNDEGGPDIGGLVGQNTESTQYFITNSFWDTQTSGQALSAGGAGVVGKTTAELMTQLTYTGKGWDFTNATGKWWMIDGSTRPFLRMEYKTSNITNAHQLQLMALNLGASYRLANNINMNELTNASGMWNTSAGFAPVGSSASPFTGSFDGQDHTIDYLYIYRPTENYVGLFGYTGSGSSISNVGMLDADITGGNYVGGIVGYNNGGAISHSYNTGYVTGSETGTAPAATGAGGIGVFDIGGNYVGGIAGYSVGGTISGSYNTGEITGVSNVGGLVGHNEGGVTTSYNTGNVTGTGSNVGGLLGENWHSSIYTSYNTGNVTGTGDNVGGLVGYNWYSNIYTSYNDKGAVTGRDYVGGLIGWSGCDISSSYSSGNVSGRYYVGGLVGWSQDQVNNTYSTGSVTGSGDYIGGLMGMNEWGTINHSYSTGSVTGTGTGVNIGGLLGINGGGAITNSFWDTTTSNRLTSAGGTGAVGKSTTDMKTLSTFTAAGWSIEDTTGTTGTIWRMKEGATYPLLRLFDPDTITGSGFIASSTTVATVATAQDPHVYDIYDLLKNKSGVMTESGDPVAGLSTQKTPTYEVAPSVFSNE